MSELEKEVINQLVNKIKTKNIGSNTEKNKIDEKKYCEAAVKLNTYGDACKNVSNNIPVCIVVEDINGKTKKIAYSRCSKTTQNGDSFCHIHRTIRKNPIKNFEKDILPQTNFDKKKWLANLKDEFFENMRKKKKKVPDNCFEFENENDIILLILNSGDISLINELYDLASPISKKIKPKKSKKVKKDKTVSTNVTERNERKESNECENHKVEEHAKDAEDSDTISHHSDEDIASIHSEFISLNDEEEEEAEMDAEITTNNGDTYYLVGNSVYKPDEEDPDSGCTEVGIFTEIHKNYHTIVYNDKFYTIMKKVNDLKKGLVYLCIVTNNIFNTKLNLIGKATFISKNKYDFNYTDEI